MSSSFFNFTSFDVQLWPPPPKTDPEVFTGLTLNPSLIVPLLLVYHALTSIVLQNPDFRDYRGRRDTIWYQLCLGHMFMLECFMIHFLLIYQKHCSLSENIALLLYGLLGAVVHTVS